MESETKEVIELDYPAISVGKNIVTRIFDLFVTLVLEICPFHFSSCPCHYWPFDLCLH